MRLMWIVGALALLASCSSVSGPGGGRADSNPDYQSIYGWTDRTENARNGCVTYHAAEKKWGQVIGCQGVETLDPRSPGAKELVDARLAAQECRIRLCRNMQGDAIPCSDVTRVWRSYVSTTRHFLVLENEGDTLWYVPEGYCSGGLSIPSALVPAFALVGLGTADAETLPSALFHDRYLCLKNHAEELLRDSPTEVGGAGLGRLTPFGADAERADNLDDDEVVEYLLQQSERRSGCS